MGNKSVQKKKYIVEKARAVFCKNGYRKVTMKDIVEACDISRGGLYLYFPDTRSLFEAVLREEQSDNALLAVVCEDGLTPGEMLLAYLEAQKKLILKQDSLTAAIFEYLFEQESDLKSVREEALSALEQLITDGVNAEWMVCENPRVAARNIVYVLDGLRIAAQVDELTETEINQEIEYVLGTLGLAVD